MSEISHADTTDDGDLMSTESPTKRRRNGGEVRVVQVIGGSEVHIGHGLLRKVPEMALAAGIKASRFVIVSDETVFGLYGQTLVDAFVAAGHTPLTFQVKPGENSKCAAAARAAAVSSVWLCACSHTGHPQPCGRCRMYKQQIEDHMLEHRCQRDTCMVALGGAMAASSAQASPAPATTSHSRTGPCAAASLSAPPPRPVASGT